MSPASHRRHHTVCVVSHTVTSYLWTELETSGKLPCWALAMEKPQSVLGDIPGQPLFWSPGLARRSDFLREAQR